MKTKIITAGIAALLTGALTMVALAAPGQSDSQATPPSGVAALASEATPTSTPDDGEGEGPREVKGIPDPESPACLKGGGCVEVETPGGVTVRVPAAADHPRPNSEKAEPDDDDEGEEGDREIKGIPDPGSPACVKCGGCVEVETPGCVTVRVPAAADHPRPNSEHAKCHRHGDETEGTD